MVFLRIQVAVWFRATEPANEASLPSQFQPWLAAKPVVTVMYYTCVTNYIGCAHFEVAEIQIHQTFLLAVHKPYVAGLKLHVLH